MDYQEIADAVQEVEQKFHGEGRVLIRPSGTEPLVRVMIEGKDQKIIDARSEKACGADYQDHALGPEKIFWRERYYGKSKSHN